MTTTPPETDDADREAVEGLADFDGDDAFDASDPSPGERVRGGTLLIELADVLRRAKLDVREVEGWKQRQRGGSGYPGPGPSGIIVHHTASPSSWNGQRDVNFITFECDAAPLANLYLDRGGGWWVLAAGATNTNGKGGPWGPIPLDSANSRVIGIEAGNNGVGEQWPAVMQNAYVEGVAALADEYGISTANILAHHEWAPTRKVDPAGPSRFGTVNSSKSWDMTTFRAAVDQHRGRTGDTNEADVDPHPLVGRPTTYVVLPGDTWWRIAKRLLGDPATHWPALAAANGGASRVLHPGDVLTVPGDPARPAVPPFPGEAQLDNRGPVVLAWQEALIAHHVIRDCPANRDAHYGTGMRGAVLALQRSWGWSDADGIAGQHTWKRLHGD